MAIAVAPRIRPIRGALRSHMVAKLAGVSLRQLWYWHNTELICAHIIPGAPGHPRLYSWVDYMKIRAASKLISQGLSTKVVREAIEYLDRNVTDWYELRVIGLSGRAVVEIGDAFVTADEGRQSAFPRLSEVLATLQEEGPLGQLRRFDSYVEMKPSMFSGNPTVRGRRLETSFIAGLADRGVSAEDIASTYSLETHQVMRVLEFSRIAA